MLMLPQWHYHTMVQHMNAVTLYVTTLLRSSG
jgi:hypothetical protein